MCWHEAILTPAFASDTVANAMNNLHPFWFLACAFLSVGPLGAFDAGQPTRGVLVLRNGEVLAGTTSKVGDRYVVARSDGTELRIPTRDVEMHCLDLDEAYLRKRQTVSRRDASAVLQLADWCLRCGLHARAADELLAAIAIAPRDPRIHGLERRLHAAVNPGPIHAVATAANTAPPSLPAPEQLPSAVPADAIESFASRVQPLLLNRCATNACHGERSDSEFRLINPGFGKTATLRHTQRNLAAVIQQLDTANPEESPLLAVPQRPHGGVAASVFGEREQSQLELLAQWVMKTSQAVPPQPLFAKNASSQLPTSGIGQPVPSPDAMPESATALPAAIQCVQRSVGSGDAPDALVDFRDPFDPERFNRRFLTPTEEQNALRSDAVSDAPGDSVAAEPAPQIP